MKKRNVIIRTITLLLIFSLGIFLFSFYSCADMPYQVGTSEFFEAMDIISRVADTVAPDTDYVCRLAVCALIVNRIEDSRFPSDVYSVVLERGEFVGVGREDFFVFSVSDLSRAAARDALLGFDVTRGAVFFRRGYSSERSGACFYHDGFLFYR